MNNTKPSITWRDAFRDHLLLTAYWRLSPPILKNKLMIRSFKHQFLAISYLIFGCLFITLGFQAILDGPDIVHYYFQGNPYPWSITLLKPGYITFLFFFSIVCAVIFILPLLVIAVFNRIYSKSPLLGKESFYICCYAILSGAIFSPIVLPITLIFLGSNPQMLFLEERFVWNVMLVGFALINGFSLFAFGYSLRSLYLHNR